MNKGAGRFIVDVLLYVCGYRVAVVVVVVVAIVAGNRRHRIASDCQHPERQTDHGDQGRDQDTFGSELVIAIIFASVDDSGRSCRHTGHQRHDAEGHAGQTEYLADENRDHREYGKA